jgi:mannose-6-phosphate isomerase-like protein (cupin superfamily)
MQRFKIAHFSEIESVNCPCGKARRAFVESDNPVASIHIVDIKKEAQTHYHKKMTEIYLVLEGEGQMELDGELHPIKPLSAILIKPGCRHRAIGDLKIVNIPIPTFNAEDEWFD